MPVCSSAYESFSTPTESPKGSNNRREFIHFEFFANLQNSTQTQEETGFIFDITLEAAELYHYIATLVEFIDGIRVVAP